jgi:hypothetical protein
MARVEESNPACFWDIYANRSSGQFPEGTPIDLIANHANYQYGNPYPELDEEGWGVHPITKRTQGGLSFNTNLGASMTVNPDIERSGLDVVLPGLTDLISVSDADKAAQEAGYGNVAEQEQAQAPSAGFVAFMDVVKNPWVLGGIALAAFILLKK